MTDWKDGYRTGSFRGVEFRTRSHQLAGGRRKQDREFAKRETGNSEDLGKKLQNFTLELYVLGDDYFSQRDALIDALEAEGSGILIHPYLGTKTVQAGDYTLSESVDEGRIARFSVQFSEAGEIKFPDQVEDDITKTSDNADSLIDNSKTAFEQVFSVANQPAFVVEAATKNIDSVVDFMDTAVKKVTEPITNLSFAISNIKASVNDLVTRPGELADILSNTFATLLNELEDDPESSSRVLGQFSTVDDEFDPVIGDTPSRQKQLGNQNAVIQLAKRLALSNDAKAVIEIDFLSTNAALDKQREIVEGLDLELESSDDDDLFQSIKDLQTSLTRVLPRTGVSELVSIELKQTTPALVIAHDEFEDLDKENEIVEENDVEHPGFVPGGETIQVSAG